ncbi:PPOX class F420-dependent oxidoreductase [Streptomyces amakusaensis]|uniref:PPOX class F420-dependent oxidoreductase n=1 Tax=Streptomyces amakusaensis TaxID=67271 RepID=A0ABW0ANZ1_9ACTN
MTAEGFATARYISLTTFRKDGTGVATPVWFVQEGGKLHVWTNRDSWKVKRLRNDPRVTVTVCDVRGRIADGAPSARGTAELLDGLDDTRKLLIRKYSWQFWLIDWPATLVRRGKRPQIGIAVTLSPNDENGL